MSKILTWLATTIGLPLLEKLIGIITDWAKSEYENYKIRKRHKDLLKKLKDAKDPEEIRAINRKLGL